jgi:16S rRNA (guanine966-N2)-methyltransferase
VRIVAGRWRGRTIKAPSGDEVRPTSDRVREAWMSIVGPSLAGALVLDLFSGSGALGLEALSRGAERVDFVEVAPRSLAALRANIEALGAGEGAVVRRADALRFIAPLGAGAYDVAFADPPYKLGLAEQVATRWLESPFATLLGVEHFSHDRMPEGGDTRRYGSTSITLYRTGER